MSTGITLNDLVREQILAEGPDLPSEREWRDQNEYHQRCEDYINEQINVMTNVELLERISSALDSLVPELSVRLGL